MTTTVRELRERYQVAAAVEEEAEALLQTRDQETKELARERYFEAAARTDEAFVSYWTLKSRTGFTFSA